MIGERDSDKIVENVTIIREGEECDRYRVLQEVEVKNREETKNVAHTGELIPSARCEEYLCKVKQKREELEKVYTHKYGR